MVEYTLQIDRIFGSLADRTRRDILHRVARQELSLKQLATPYHMSFAAIAKHVTVLEKAGLIRKRRDGKQQIVSIVPETLLVTQKYLDEYAKLWEERYQNLDSLVSNSSA